jgi:hypothetical protein
MPVTDHVKLCTATHSSIRLLMCKGTRERGNYALFRKRMIMTGWDAASWSIMQKCA